MIPKIWELFPDLAKAVKAAHDQVGLNGTGHDFDHALRVAQMAYVVGYPHHVDMAMLAGVAGLLHNNDRILERKLQIKSGNVSRVPDEAVAHMTRKMIRDESFTDQERVWIIDAVINHGSKPNSDEDHLVIIALVDADRLINMEPDAIIRSGQHHADIPALDPVYIEATPGSNYRDPRTVAWDIANCITWADETGPYVLRLPLSRKLGLERANFLRVFLDTIKSQRQELGLFPYPQI